MTIIWFNRRDPSWVSSPENSLYKLKVFLSVWFGPVSFLAYFLSFFFSSSCFYTSASSSKTFGWSACSSALLLICSQFPEISIFGPCTREWIPWATLQVNTKYPKHITFWSGSFQSLHATLGIFWDESSVMELNLCLSALLLLCPHLARRLTWMKVLCAVTATHGGSRSSYGLLRLRRTLKTLVRKNVSH